MAREIILITAGIAGEWEPTDDELAALTELFTKAVEDPQGAVISVRQGVEVSLIPLPDAPKKKKVEVAKKASPPPPPKQVVSPKKKVSKKTSKKPLRAS